MVARIKVLANMRLDEKRKPQDGRIKLIIGGSPIDYRVSSLPTRQSTAELSSARHCSIRSAATSTLPIVYSSLT
mgnify:CR=1 FL=1